MLYKFNVLFFPILMLFKVLGIITLKMFFFVIPALLTSPVQRSGLASPAGGSRNSDEHFNLKTKRYF